MIRIYRCRHTAEAPLMLSHLKAAGIHAVVQDEASGSLFGGLRVPGVGASIWVDKADRELAEFVIAEVHRELNPPDCPFCGYDLRGLDRNQCPECGEPFEAFAPWVCDGCGETVEAEFGVCWNCGAERDDAPDEEENAAS